VSASPEQPGRDRALPIGLAVAYAAFAATFRGRPERFWQRMTRTGLALAGIALVAEPVLRRTRIRARDLAAGIGSAAALYGIFRVGDRLARRLMPTGGDDIDEVYRLRRLRSRPELALRLALVIGPAEELFWRGLVQRRLAERSGRWRAAAVAAMAYAGAHVASENPTLVGAAGVAGAYWSALAAAGMPMGSLIVSHVAWDIWIFLLSPTAPAA
jgi:membrane protease YdiL (CAAX protease family)